MVGYVPLLPPAASVFEVENMGIEMEPESDFVSVGSG